MEYGGEEVASDLPREPPDAQPAGGLMARDEHVGQADGDPEQQDATAHAAQCGLYRNLRG